MRFDRFLTTSPAGRAILPLGLRGEDDEREKPVPAGPGLVGPGRLRVWTLRPVAPERTKDPDRTPSPAPAPGLGPRPRQLGQRRARPDGLRCRLLTRS